MTMTDAAVKAVGFVKRTDGKEIVDEGEVVECGPTENVVANPQSACAKKLMSSVFSLGGLD